MNLLEKIRGLRLNFNSWIRKIKLSRQIDTNKVTHLFKTVDCDHEWYGNSYGGFYINPKLLNQNSIIYSFGIGKDISFDRKCIKMHKCRIYAFDPTAKSKEYMNNQRISESIIFYNYGITDAKSGIYKFYMPINPRGISGSLIVSKYLDENKSIMLQMKSIDDIVLELGHDHIDVLKLDIEGSEYSVLKNILKSEITIDQILVEFHDRIFDNSYSKSREVVCQLNDYGYEVFAHSSTYEEVSFIHKNKL